MASIKFVYDATSISFCHIITVFHMTIIQYYNDVTYNATFILQSHHEYYELQTQL